MQSRIFNIILVIVFITLIGLYAYKNTRQPVTLKAPINKQVESILDSTGSNKAIVFTSKEELNEAIKDYIMNNPEDIMSSLETLQEKNAKKSLEKTSNYLKENQSTIEDSASPPIVGNPNGDIKIVIFYDYTCSFCKKGNDYINQIIEADSGVKVILRPIPILGGNSMYAAKVALAIQKISKDKFYTIHNEMLAMKSIDVESIKALVAKHDIDYAVVENEVNSYSIKQLIAKNFEIAKALGMQGAPSYVINGNFIPGLISPEKFETIILQIRSTPSDGLK